MFQLDCGKDDRYDPVVVRMVRSMRWTTARQDGVSGSLRPDSFSNPEVAQGARLLA